MVNRRRERNESDHLRKNLLWMVFLVLILSTAFLSGCQKISMDVPEGFAKIEDPDELYTAVTPEGMKLSVRREKNYPEKEAAFWGDALNHHLNEEGYTKVSREEGVIAFDCPVGKGTYIEWGVPYGGKDYLYLTGVVVQGKDLFVIQAAGPYSVYKEYQKGIKTSLSTFSLKGIFKPVRF